ncbi:unnamed protein product [Caenorhabditis angaria]|uniref:Uncharacterized protein n=1 Tax=Caenorhabditis angaria TaxID=860376 RepID=A0A9P1INA9_9PELO|nr:unnamed protein product [Caenorhabditis angaria]
MPEKSKYKIVVLGDVGCGKSALVKRFVRNEIVRTYDPTIEDKYVKKMEFRGNLVELEIVDTSGKVCRFRGFGLGNLKKNGNYWRISS